MTPQNQTTPKDRYYDILSEALEIVNTMLDILPTDAITAPERIRGVERGYFEQQPSAIPHDHDLMKKTYKDWSYCPVCGILLREEGEEEIPEEIPEELPIEGE